jgi:hypothetical protein
MGLGVFGAPRRHLGAPAFGLFNFDSGYRVVGVSGIISAAPI